MSFTFSLRGEVINFSFHGGANGISFYRAKGVGGYKNPVGIHVLGIGEMSVIFGGSYEFGSVLVVLVCFLVDQRISTSPLQICLSRIPPRT